MKSDGNEKRKRFKQLGYVLMILAIMGASVITYLFLWVPAFYGIGIPGFQMFLFHILIVVVLFAASIWVIRKP